MGGLFGFVILILDIIAIMDCIKSIKDNGKKLLWIIVILVMPGVGLILYYLLGKKSA